MFTRDDAKHPCTQTTCVRGFAVGHIEPYRCTRVRIGGWPIHSAPRNQRFGEGQAMTKIVQVIVTGSTDESVEFIHYNVHNNDW